MVINGREIAQKITDELQIETNKLKSQGKTPTIAIITLGDEASWKTYVGQKIKLAEKLGIQTKLITIKNSDEQELLSTIKQCNNDTNIAGIIVQRPFTNEIDKEKVIDAIVPQKDIDGFRSDSPYKVPVWLAVERLLQEVWQEEHSESDFKTWLTSKKIAVIGRGETAGGPVIKELTELGLNPIVYTQNSDLGGLKEANIIISAVGKRVVEGKFLKKGVVLIGIGINRGEEGKLHGDYDEKEIESIASFYTPTPGGVGPVNLAFLFKNLIEAAKK